MNWSDIGFTVIIKFSTVQKTSTKPVPCLNHIYTERRRLISRSSALAFLIFLIWPRCLRKNSPASQLVVAFGKQNKTTPKNLVIILSLAYSQGLYTPLPLCFVSSLVNSDLENKKQFCVSGYSCKLELNHNCPLTHHCCPFLEGKRGQILWDTHLRECWYFSM